jgi:hypothetical protein
MSEPEQIQIIVKKIATTYEVYTLDQDELRDYLNNQYDDEPLIHTIRAKLWKWLKGFSNNKKVFFVYRYESDYKERIDEPIEDKYDVFNEMMDTKVTSLLRPRRTLRR